MQLECNHTNKFQMSRLSRINYVFRSIIRRTTETLKCFHKGKERKTHKYSQDWNICKETDQGPEDHVPFTDERITLRWILGKQVVGREWNSSALWRWTSRIWQGLVVRFQVLTAASMKITVFWMIALMMEAVRTSETSVYSNETTRCYIAQGLVRLMCGGTRQGM
jgi:hypothetical protein